MISDFRLKRKQKNPQSAIPALSPVEGRNPQSKGFSLIEIIVAIGIGVLVTLLLGEFIVSGYKNYTVTADQTTQVAIARRIQDTITKELREAVIAEGGAYPLITANANELIFTSDVDRDAVRERVRYTHDGALLFRGVTKPVGDPPTYEGAPETVRTLAQYLTGTDPVFRYSTADGTELIPPFDITRVTLVGIAFTIDAAPGRLPRGTTVMTTVQLRNIKANLGE